MPVLSLAHSKFWRPRNNVVVVGPPDQAPAYYPAWQASVITGSILGGLQLFWERFAYACRWWLTAWRWSKEPRRVEALLGVADEAWQALTPDQRRAMTQALRVVRSPDFHKAQMAVFATSRAEKFNEHQAWSEVSDALAKGGRGVAENMWRHMHALQAITALTPDLPNPDRNLLIELAYHEFAASGRGKPSMDR